MSTHTSPTPSTAYTSITAAARSASLAAKLTGTGGALALLSLPLTWFKLDPSGDTFDEPASAVSTTASGFSSGGLVTLAMLALGLLALYTTLTLTTDRAFGGRSRPFTVVAGSAGVAFLTLVWTAMSPPNLLPGGDVVNGFASVVGFGPSAQLGIYLAVAATFLTFAGALQIPGAPFAAADQTTPEGTLRRAVLHARATDAKPVLASLALGAFVPAAAMLSALRDSTNLLWVAVIAAIGAIVTARMARKHAETSEDPQLAALARVGQASGWCMLGAILALVLYAAVVISKTAQSVGAL